MLLTPSSITNLLLDTLFVLYGAIAFWYALKAVLWWDFSKSDTRQYRLQKQLYLLSTITKYIFLFKILLLLFFIYTLDHLADLISGAMCGVGVLDASPIGIHLMLLKVINLYLFGFWILLNEADYRCPTLCYTKIKSLFYLLLYGLLVAEVGLEYRFFFDIDTDSLAKCCVALFSTDTPKSYLASLLSLLPHYHYATFYLLALAMLLAYITAKRLLYALFSLLLIPVALVSLIAYFGTYIYELPTHHCPFCLLQADYGYVGYLLYSALYVATFFGMASGFSPKRAYLKLSLLGLFVYVALISYYPLHYYLQNSRWLY